MWTTDRWEEACPVYGCILKGPHEEHFRSLGQDAWPEPTEADRLLLKALQIDW